MSTYVSNRNGGGQTDEQGHYRFQTKIWTGNVLQGLLVKENSPLARNVLVPAGDLKIDYGEYAYTAWNDADVTVSIATADTTNPRLDRIVAYVDRSLTSGGTNNPGYLKFLAVAGTPAGSPTKASDNTVQTAVNAAAGATTSPWCEIAVVRVEANATTIPASKITDTRTMVTSLRPTRDYPGIIKDYAGNTPPVGYLLCAGQAVSRTTYADLFAAIGTLWGSGDGSTTFNVPDLRGYVTAGADNMNGSAANVLQKQPTITTTSGSPTATVSSATGLAIGMRIISANVPAGTTITNIVGTTITMSGNASNSASGTAARFEYGNITDAQTVGAKGGEAAHVQTTPELVSHNHTQQADRDVSPGSGLKTPWSGGTPSAVIPTLNTGGGNAANILQPTAILNKIIAY